MGSLHKTVAASVQTRCNSTCTSASKTHVARACVCVSEGANHALTAVTTAGTAHGAVACHAVPQVRQPPHPTIVSDNNAKV